MFSAPIWSRKRHGFHVVFATRSVPTKTNGIDADTLAHLPLFDPAGLQPLELPGPERAALDRRVRATDRLTAAGAEHKRRIKDLVRQLWRRSTPSWPASTGSR